MSQFCTHLGESFGEGKEEERKTDTVMKLDYDDIVRTYKRTEMKAADA